jgi:hypothetical protein
MNDQHKYKFLIVDGSYIFSKVEKYDLTENFIILNKPLKMVFHEDEEQINYSFCPWVLFSNQENYPVSTRSITTIANLNEESISLYKKAITGTFDKKESDNTESSLPINIIN